MIAVEVQDLVVESEGYPIVKGLNLTIEEGDQVGILGDLNDAAALLKVLSGATLPTSGEIWVYNMPPRQALQRGLVSYAIQPNLIQTTPAIVLLTPSFHSFAFQSPNVIFHPLIEFSDKSIQENYRYGRVTQLIKRKGGTQS